MRTATSARAPQTVAAPPIPRAWLWWAAGVVIAAQLIAVGLVASRQVEQAAERQATWQAAVASRLASTTTVASQ